MRAKLLIAIHEIEDTFVAYSEDIIERVVQEMQNYHAESNQSQLKRKFKLKKQYSISVNLLLNDI